MDIGDFLWPTVEQEVRDKMYDELPIADRVQTLVWQRIGDPVNTVLFRIMSQLRLM